ncbi:diacylglycerol/lipid kinase family protein [Novacetimonas pomaceti]|uniref:Diacylglycerol kinase n=1 Tax=Novacetimonas pomaceti TaxID=2021998 RepID=A0ABX5P785_9PROT|nr:acylglycerol kinase family protein [Novacetimonas pomaceti]PYD48777.1 diacylglycerol kinase [Novacetimonas pomaceti]
MTARFVIIHNPRSRRNRSGNEHYSMMARQSLGENFLSPASQAELLHQVEELARRDVGCIVVDGGDGTLSDVLSAIHRYYRPDRLPALALLPSGNTNLIAGDVGFGLRGVEALVRLNQLALGGDMRRNIRRRRGLVVSWSDPQRPSVVGMFHGTAAFRRAIELAHQPAILDRYSHEMAVVVTLGSSVAHLLSRRFRREWTQGDRLSITVGDAPARQENCFLFLATTLQSLPYGVWPFWHGVDSDDDGIRYLDVAGMPPRLTAAVTSLLRGRVPQWLRNESAYDSGCAMRIRLEMKEDFVLDGEVLDSGPDGVTYLSVTPPIDFIQA